MFKDFVVNLLYTDILYCYYLTFLPKSDIKIDCSGIKELLCAIVPGTESIFHLGFCFLRISYCLFRCMAMQLK